ncbi:hypothetical protein [Sinomicrobium sp. M5D2P17]
MKTKQIIISTTFFIIATLSAFALSLQTSLFYRTVEANPASCTKISVACDFVPLAQCRVASPVGVRLVWRNAGCTQIVGHSSWDILLPQ